LLKNFFVKERAGEKTGTAKGEPKAERQRKAEAAAGVRDANTPAAGETEKKRLPAKKELRREAV
jgi:hypothetical protein